VLRRQTETEVQAVKPLRGARMKLLFTAAADPTTSGSSYLLKGVSLGVSAPSRILKINKLLALSA
jgi:hypothetical protein